MIGKLDRRISIIQPVYSQGVSGEDKLTGWELIDSVPEVWAQKIDTRGNTLVQGDRVVYSQTITWIVRFRTDLNISMRLVDSSSQVYSILGTAEYKESKTFTNNRNRYTEITTNIIDNEYWT